ncbi:MAG: hypothetical protein WBM52_00135 [Thiogranum sp.]
MENPSALILLFVSFLLLAACSSQQTAPEEEAPELDYDLLLTLPDQPISYHESVKPVLENRCVVCHGCIATMSACAGTSVRWITAQTTCLIHPTSIMEPPN